MASSTRYCIGVLAALMGGVGAHAGELVPLPPPFASPPTRFEAQFRPVGSVLLADTDGPRQRLVLLPQLPAPGRGDAVLRVSLDRNGTPREVELVESSDKPLLDRAIVDTVWRSCFAGPDDNVAAGYLLVHRGSAGR